jgi:hypothetical protein
MKTNPNLAIWLACSMLAAGVAVPGDAAATCINASPVSTDEAVLSSRLACNWDFVVWADTAYGTAGGDNWDDPNNGRQDACNAVKPFAKWMDTTALLTHDFTTASSNGIARSFFNPGGLQWHGLNDYSESPKAAANEYHDGVYCSVMDDVAPPGSPSITWAAAKRTRTWSLFSGWTSYEWTELYCQSFDNAMSTFAGGSEPGWRAAVALHESWHHWQAKHGYSMDHAASCPGGAGTSCDYFYFHKLRDYDFGQLPSYSTGSPLLFHSPQQVSTEYLCDLAEEGTDWVSSQVAVLSKLEANYLIANVFVHPVPWTCGTNRIPLYP